MSEHEQCIELIKEACKSLNILRTNVEQQIENLKLGTEKWVRHDGDHTPAELLVTFEQYINSQYRSMYIKLTKNAKYKNAKAQLSAIKGSKKTVGGKKVTSSPPSTAIQAEAAISSDKDMAKGLQNIKKQEQHKKLQTESQQLQEIKKKLSDHLNMAESEWTNVTLPDVLEQILRKMSDRDDEIKRTWDELVGHKKDRKKREPAPSLSEVFTHIKKNQEQAEAELREIKDLLPAGQCKGGLKKDPESSTKQIILNMKEKISDHENEIQRIKDEFVGHNKDKKKQESTLSLSEIFTQMKRQSSDHEKEIQWIKDEFGGQNKDNKKQEASLSLSEIFTQMKRQISDHEKEINEIQRIRDEVVGQKQDKKKQEPAPSLSEFFTQMKRQISDHENEIQRIRDEVVGQKQDKKKQEPAPSLSEIFTQMKRSHEQVEAELKEIKDLLADQFKEGPMKDPESSPKQIILNMKKKVNDLENEITKIKNELVGEAKDKKKPEHELSLFEIVIRMKRENSEMKKGIKEKPASQTPVVITEQTTLKIQEQDLQSQSQELRKIKETFFEQFKEECKSESEITADTIVSWMTRVNMEKDKQAVKQNQSWQTPSPETEQKIQQQVDQSLKRQSQELQTIKKTFVEICKGEKKTESEITAEMIVVWMTSRQMKDDKQISKQAKQKATEIKKEGKYPKDQQQAQQSQELNKIKKTFSEFVCKGKKKEHEITADEITEWIIRLEKEIDDETQILRAIKQELGLENIPDHRKYSLNEALGKVIQMKSKLQGYQTKFKEQDEQIHKIYMEKESALHRLSEMAGVRLTDGNPNISDLSDPNRPIKIGEQYSELYDNLWTDAFDQLTIKPGVKDKDAICLLRDILEEAYKYCRTTASRQQIQIVADLTMVTLSKVDQIKTVPKKKDDDSQRKTVLTTEDITKLLMIMDNPNADGRRKIITKICGKLGLTDVDMKQLKNMIRQSAECTSTIVQQEFTRQITKELERHNIETLKHYAHKCAHVCWLMLAQDPPVCLRPWKNDVNNSFDKDVYKEYTSSGTVLDFVVWPALYLHEGGALLRKGVAQPKQGGKKK